MDDEDFKNTSVIAWMKCAYTVTDKICGLA